MVNPDIRLEKALFNANPNLYIEKAIKEFVATSPLNCLPSCNNIPISEEPLVALADGDDSIFQDYKTIIGDHHITPREAMEKYIESRRWRYDKKTDIKNISVVSYAMPISREARLSERNTPHGGSAYYNHTRWLGEKFRIHLRDYLVLLLELMGHYAVTPSRFVETKTTPNGLMAGWSERHVAYACGLGTFGLNGLMITSRGCAIYLGSIVCDIRLTPTLRNKDSHTANCLYYYDGSCRTCIERCVGNAIDDQGRSNLKCRENLTRNQPENLKQLGLDNDLVGGAPACGLCSNGVPCEDKIPVPLSKFN